MRAERFVSNSISYCRAAAIVVLLIAIAPSGSFANSREKGFCAGEQEDLAFSTTPKKMASLGGVQESHSSGQNSDEIDGLARFAVEQHNNKENALLEFVRVVKAQHQVVSGTLHHLTIEAIDAGKKKLYEAKVWVKPWMNFKEVQEFNLIGDAPTLTSSDLGVKKEEHAQGWQAVPAHDPLVQDAAHHAVNTIQQRSNALFPYELQEISHSQAEVTGGTVKIDMLLKLKRGDKEEKFKVEVHKNDEGTFRLNQMNPEHN